MIIQLNPAIPVITTKGPALAHIIIDNGIEYDLNWICFQDYTGECWTWKKSQIRAQKNMTHGRDHISPFYNPDDVSLKSKDSNLCEECGEYKDECICED